MEETSISDILATICFALAILHTFSVKLFQHLALKYREGSVGENLFHLLGEIEVVFGIWASIYLSGLFVFEGKTQTLSYLQNLNFTEPVFVFIIMSVCSTKPILDLASQLIEFVSNVIPLKKSLAFYISALVLGPLLGSFITEPAAMTVTALILFEKFYQKGISTKLMYATIGVLFVNISIGGTLTPYAAPPVLMVAGKWGWDLNFMLTHFGWKGALACGISSLFVAYKFRKEIVNIDWPKNTLKQKSPMAVGLIHLLFLAGIVASSHYMIIFVGVFLFFLGLYKVTMEYQSEIKIKEALLVGFFLGGIVVLGAPQKWWLEPLITQLSALPLYLGSMGLTAITDNAALTYLGSQALNLSEASKYALVAGSVVGGGLTVIANAPNPAGFGILNPSFGKEGINPILLFRSALIPTMVAAVCFWFL